MRITRSFCAFVAIALFSAQTASASQPEAEIMTTSWYGPGMKCYETIRDCLFLMANGQEFDMNDPTVAAHKELPFGTRLRLTNPENDRSVIVTVQDRGPFVADRELDVSKGAAQQLGFIGTGVIDLQVEQLD